MLYNFLQYKMEVSWQMVHIYSLGGKVCELLSKTPGFFAVFTRKVWSDLHHKVPNIYLKKHTLTKLITTQTLFTFSCLPLRNHSQCRLEKASELLTYVTCRTSFSHNGLHQKFSELQNVFFFPLFFSPWIFNAVLYQCKHTTSFTWSLLSLCYTYI